jgi:RND superfamily putative drug exporter
VAERFADGVVRWRYVVVVGWLLLAFGAFQFLPSIEEGGGHSVRGLVPEDSVAVQTEIEAFKKFGTPLLSRTQVVQRNPEGLTPFERARVYLRAISLNRGLYPDLDRIAGALPVTNSFEVFPQKEESTTAITYLFFLPEHSPTKQDAAAHAFARKIEDRGDSLVGVTGAIPGRLAQGRLLKEHLSSVEILTVALVALIVGVHFRSMAAPIATLTAAGVAYAITVHVVPWVVGLLDLSVPAELEPVIVVLLLGIVTDYSIFFIDGSRDPLASGQNKLQAARHATSSIVTIIFVAGLTVAAGTAALSVASLDIFSALGPGLAFTVVVGLLVSITMIPATIAILGKAMFWPFGPREHRARKEGAIRRKMNQRYRNRRMAAVVCAVAVLLLAGSAVFISDMSLGFSVVGALPDDSEPKIAAEAASAGFAPGVISPLMLVLQSEGIGNKEQRLVEFEDLLEQRPGIAGVVGPEEVVSLARLLRRVPQIERERGSGGEEAAEIALRAVVSEDNNAARFLLIFDQPPLTGSAIDIYKDLREDMFPLIQQTQLGRVGIRFAGDTAIAYEMISRTIDDLKRVAVAVFLVDLFLLALFLRAIVAPLYLMLASMLGFAATLGATTIFFQFVLDGDSLSFFVPFAASVLLVSLGSDYNIFLVGSIWRKARKTPLVDAMEIQAPAASRAIAVAGLTLAASFAILAVVPVDIFRQFAFAMSFGLLLDTFVVRPFLVPALVTMFGELSRWPSPARRGEQQEEERP